MVWELSDAANFRDSVERGPSIAGQAALLKNVEEAAAAIVHGHREPRLSVPPPGEPLDQRLLPHRAAGLHRDGLESGFKVPRGITKDDPTESRGILRLVPDKFRKPR